MSKYVLTEADIENIEFAPNTDFKTKGKKKVSGTFNMGLSTNIDYSAKGLTIELIQYTPEEIAEVPLKTILKGIWLKVKNQVRK